MTSTRLQIIAGSALALAASIAAIRPRAAEPETVQLDFMLAALSQSTDFGAGTSRPAVLSGQVVAQLAEQVKMPPGSTTLGSVMWGRATDVYGLSNGTPDDVRRWFDADFVKRGFVVIDQRGISPLRGGFRDADVGVANGYCSSEGQYFTVTARPRVPAGVDFRIRVTPGGQCGFNSPGGGFRDAITPPLLYNPPMSQTTQRCYPGFEDMMRQVNSAAISSSLAPQEIIAHYQKQLEKDGWKRTNAPSSASATWSKHDAGGSDLLVSVGVTPGAETDCRSLEMRFKETRK